MPLYGQKYNKQFLVPRLQSQQRGGRAGRETPGVCVRLVTQLEWNNMPPRDPPQPHMDDQTALYLRLASTEAVSSIRERLLDTIGMTKELRAEAQQVLFLHDLVDTYGHLTEKGTFVSNLDCETEHGCLLWIAKEYDVLSRCNYHFCNSGKESNLCVQ